ncbi:MAG TPA: hypothetical protein VMG13_14035 [Trebonia sp.]|nr:hypothetical protein [Trebonia sp.]
MAGDTIIVLVIVLVLLAVAAALAATLLLRRRALRRRFGPEYDQLVRDVGQRQAEAELAERRRRVAQLNIQPLSPERRAGYDREWVSLQEGFIDGPARSAATAAALVLAVAADRGYPVGDDDQLFTDLSVHHAKRLDGYQQARRTAEQAGTASTEELRVALLAHRALFLDLLGPGSAGERPADATATSVPSPVTSITPGPPSTPSSPRTSSTPAAAIARTLKASDDRTRSDDRTPAPAARKD